MSRHRQNDFIAKNAFAMPSMIPGCATRHEKAVAFRMHKDAGLIVKPTKKAGRPKGQKDSVKRAASWGHKSPQQDKLLLIIVGNPGISRQECAAIMDATPVAIGRMVGRLIERGLVKRKYTRGNVNKGRATYTPTSEGMNVTMQEGQADERS